MKNLLNIRQEDNESPTAYYKRFINTYGVAEAQFGPVLPQEIVDKVEDYEIMDEAQQEVAEDQKNKNLQHLPSLRAQTGPNMAR